MGKVEHILSLSYGKDSLACLGAIEKLGWPLDRIVHAEIWATPEIPADLPEMVNFKYKADKIILERWGIKVEHFRSKVTFEEQFYKVMKRRNGETCIYGFPYLLGVWCRSCLKVSAINEAIKGAKGCIQYIGIAADEPERFHNFTNTKKSPLVELGWDEAYCRKWCEENDLLSPIYTTVARGGCWFCHNQSVNQLRLLRKNHPDLWALMLKWDADSPVTFKTDGHTVHDFDNRFALEDEGVIDPKSKWNWAFIDFPQVNLFAEREKHED